MWVFEWLKMDLQTLITRPYGRERNSFHVSCQATHPTDQVGPGLEATVEPLLNIGPIDVILVRRVVVDIVWLTAIQWVVI